MELRRKPKRETSMGTLHDALKTALNTQLAVLFPSASYPVENAEYAIVIDEYAAARAAQQALSTRPHSSYSTLGVSFGFRDPGGAARTSAQLAVRLARAGFSIDAGTATIHDLRGAHEFIA